MNSIRNDVQVLIVTGYMDCQCLLQGLKGRVVGQAGKRWLVKDEEGGVEYYDSRDLQVVDDMTASPTS